MLYYDNNNILHLHNLKHDPILIEESKKPQEKQPELLRNIPETIITERKIFVNNYERQPSTNSPRKADNTLIKKIYSNPVVRSFALTNRDTIPGELYSVVKNESLVDATIAEVAKNPPKLSEALPPYDYLHQIREKSPKILSTPAFSLEFSDSESNQEPIKETADLKTKREPIKNLEFEELREKRLVANRLGQFSKSYPNLAVETPRFTHNDFSHYEAKEAHFPTTSVKDLKKLFESKSVS